ncbi:Gfo/Idh/MocA family oxidoreductase [candidate division KSB1 bacterium]|nr:Gfo/Idh/MocA family oxidoreductase [candidate division KSB1 bacterium]
MKKNKTPNQSTNQFNRRDFVKLGTATLGAAFAGMKVSGCAAANKKIGPAPEHPFVSKPLEKVRIGFVGVGGMGSAHVRNLLRIDKVELKAVCDIVPEKVERIQKWTVEAGQAKPTGYSRGDYDFVRMCETEDLDLVYTATPWRWHVPVCVAAMKNGKHAATEVPAALTIDECWQLVETSEKLKKHCIMMENCCYDRPELLIFNLARKGLLGEIIHGECGYLHDLRALKFASDGEALWRPAHSINRNGNLYPTHGLGPVAQCMNVNRGDQFDYLVSMSSPSRGLNLFAAEKFGANDPRAKQKYALGDVNISLIQTKNGKTITIWHDCDTPRPYSRNILVQGTKGIARRWPNEVHIEGRSEAHHWDKLEDYYEEFDHPLWKNLNQSAKGAGHGGMDFIEDYRLIQCLLEGTPMDMDVYDAAAWSVVSELSEKSVASRSKAIDFPDFTRGKWKTNKPLGIIAEGEVN